MLGDLSEFSLPELLQMFERSSKTGRLSIWSPTGIHRIWFYQGRVTAALAPDDQYHLKQMLLSMGNLRPECIEYLNNIKDAREPLGKSLKQQGLIDTSILALAFRKQIKAGVHSLFQLQSGQFRFAANAPLPYEEMTGLSKGGLEVAIAGLRSLEPTLKDENTLPQPDSIFARTSEELPLLKLSPLEWGLLEKATQNHKLCWLAEMMQADLLEVRKACRRLSAVGLLEEVVAASANSAASPSLSSGSPLDSERPASLAQPKTVGSTQAVGGTKKPVEAKSTTEVNPTLLNRLASLLKSVK